MDVLKYLFANKTSIIIWLILYVGVNNNRGEVFHPLTFVLLVSRDLERNFCLSMPFGLSFMKLSLEPNFEVEQ